MIKPSNKINQIKN